jgi:hypothetical protein
MAGLRKSSGIILAAGLIGFGFLSPAFSQAADPLSDTGKRRTALVFCK